jgi:hypothetical protein
MFKLNSQKEYLMNTYTNAVHPEEKADRTAHKNISHNAVIMTIVLALITVAAIAIYTANRSVIAANNPAVEYGNALEMQYARPWLEAQNKPVIEYGNALELQYAQPWLDKAKLSIAVTGSAQSQLDCGSSLEMFYACKYGYARP